MMLQPFSYTKIKTRRRGKQPHRRLSQEQQDLLVQHLGRICTIAHRVWQQSCLPATYWDELRADAMLYACICAIGYVSGKWPFLDVLSYQLRKHLWKRVLWYRHKEEDRGGDFFDHLAIENPLEEDGIEMVVKLLSALPDRQRQVLEFRYGLIGEVDLTHKEIGEKLGIGKSSVCLAEQRGLDNLRKLLRGGLNTEKWTIEEIKKNLSHGGKWKRGTKGKKGESCQIT